MEKWTEIRRRVLVEGTSKRQIQRETGLSWPTLEKVLTHGRPPGYRRTKPYPKPKIGPYLDRIAQIMEADKEVPRKQRHTAKRIFERIREEGYEGGYTQVKEAVRAFRRTKREVFVPLIHRPGEAQVDFGQALVKEAGVLRKVVFFVMVLPHSDAVFVQVFDRECTEVYWEAHRRAFEFFGGVPCRITYDNASVLVAAIIGPHERNLTRGFLELKSHYLFETHSRYGTDLQRNLTIVSAESRARTRRAWWKTSSGTPDSTSWYRCRRSGVWRSSTGGSSRTAAGT